ncbi:apiosidase-like domain-containing protein [Microbacterium mangrovi]|uniref:apiosidase-like domain-containing protein n=1 Tax=Microbacterium mangrovi TaxID=1348253 RepID=UPI0006899B1A|nr:DUF4038 domain-containing protein [Microbacterium mangrovi]
MPLTAGLGIIEVELTSGPTALDPYLEIDVTVEFRGPGDRVITRPAFWDGGSTWRVRFAPPAPGEWRYIATEAHSVEGLHAVTGTVTARGDVGDTLNQRQGFLEISSDGRHLCDSDGTPFFWLADTHWRFAWERWDEANKSGWSSQFRDTVDLRVRQGFTVYQSNLMSWDPPHPWTDGDYSSMAPEYFRDIIDPRMAYIAESGLVNALGLAWHDAADTDSDGLVRLARYVVARYGCHPIVWTLGGEVAGYEPDLRDHRIRVWREVALAIQAADDYHHPITAHLTTERPLASYYQDEDWLSFTLNQLGHGDLDMRAHHWADHLAAHPGRPMVEGEAFYEGLRSVEYTGRRVVTDVMVRQVAYRAIQSGCCGYSYGAQGCWNGAWDDAEAQMMWGELPWYEGVDLAGAGQLGYLRRLYESLNWWELRPAHDLLLPSSSINSTFFPPLVTADEERRTILVYFAEAHRWGANAGTLRGLQSTAYRLEWFDPRTAGRSIVLDATPEADGTLIIPGPPGGDDWILIARAR